MIGLGTWQMFDGSAVAAVKSAIELGYRHIDCAWIYQNEADVGKALSDCFQDRTLSREELFVTSKLWNNRHRPGDVEGALKATLADLQLEYVDMYLIHWPIAQVVDAVRPESAADFETLDDVPLSETWSAIVECQSQGLCRNVGVSNFSQSKIEDLVEKTGVRPSCLQVESHPFLQQTSLFEYCRSHQMVYVAYSPLGSGARPKSLKKEREPNLFECQVLLDIAESHSITPAQAMLAWAVGRGSVVIPKSVSPKRQKLNLQAAEIELSDSEMAAISALDRNYRFVDGSFWEVDSGPYTAAGIWA